MAAIKEESEEKRHVRFEWSEPTVHEAEGLQMYRPKESALEKKWAWQPLHRSVADLHRWCVPGERVHEGHETTILRPIDTQLSHTLHKGLANLQANR